MAMAEETKQTTPASSHGSPTAEDVPTNEKLGPVKSRHVTTKDAPEEARQRKTDGGDHILNGGKIILTEAECYDELGFGFPTWKKWMILSVIFLVQVGLLIAPV